MLNNKILNIKKTRNKYLGNIYAVQIKILGKVSNIYIKLIGMLETPPILTWLISNNIPHILICNKFTNTHIKQINPLNIIFLTTNLSSFFMIVKISTITGNMHKVPLIA